MSSLLVLKANSAVTLDPTLIFLYNMKSWLFVLFKGKCPSPLKNRDFVTMRSWLPLGNDYLIINYSVKHPVCLHVLQCSVGAVQMLSLYEWFWPSQRYSTVYCVRWHVEQLSRPRED